MSLEAIDIMNTDRANQLALSPSSETFQIVGGDTFTGIFDRAHFEENKDDGNNEQKILSPVIMVSTVPAGLVERQTEITRENGTDTYKLFFIGKDDEGIPLLWLF